MTPLFPHLPPLDTIFLDQVLEQWISLLKRMSPTRITVIPCTHSEFGKYLREVTELIFSNYDSCASEEVLRKKVYIVVLVDHLQYTSNTHPDDMFLFYADGTSLHVGEAFEFHYGETDADDCEEADDSVFVVRPHYYIWEGGFIPYICSVNRIQERLCGKVPIPPPFM